MSAWIRGLEEVAQHLEKWAFDLPEEAFWWRPKEGANPIGGLVRHITGSSLRLASYALGLPLPEWAKRGREWELQGEAEPKERVVARFREAWESLVSALKEVREEALAEEVAVGHLGAKAPRAHVLHHLVEHAQHHAGQVIYARKLL
ncbi:DinB family protein [Thermus thalpophilus]